MAARNVYRYPPLNGCPPYSLLAPVYDRLMAHVEYHSWLALVKNVISRYLSTPAPAIFEIGAGTGVLGRMLRDEGFAYLGSDISAPMCGQAVGRGLGFVCADGRNLPVKASFDLCLFLYDGINYLLDAGDYQRLFGEVHRCLADGGCMLFDVTTEANSMKHFRDFLDFEDFDDCSYVRHSYFEPSSRIQFNDFTIFVRQPGNGRSLYGKYFEKHVQKVLPVRDIVALIPADLFSVAGIWDGFSFRRFSQRSERIHFLLRKTGAA